MSEENTQFYNIATTVICTLALIFNVLGIYLLKATRLGSSFQRNIIVSLSCCDILISSGTLIIITLQFFGHKLMTSRAAQVVWGLREGVYHTWISLFYLLTVDRFLGCNFPLRYRTWTYAKKCRIILGLSWGIAILLGPIFNILDPMQVRVYSNRYLWPIYDGIFLFLFMVTYVSVFYRKKQSIQNLHRTSSGPGNQRFFALTLAMLTAFILFETIPTIVSAAIAMESLKTRDVFQHIFELCWNINYLVDPFIYIFLMPRVRNTAINKLRSLCLMFRKNSAQATASNNTSLRNLPTTVYITKNDM